MVPQERGGSELSKYIFFYEDWSTGTPSKVKIWKVTWFQQTTFAIRQPKARQHHHFNEWTVRKLWIWYLGFYYDAAMRRCGGPNPNQFTAIITYEWGGITNIATSHSSLISSPPAFPSSCPPTCEYRCRHLSQGKWSLWLQLLHLKKNCLRIAKHWKNHVVMWSDNVAIKRWCAFSSGWNGDVTDLRQNEFVWQCSRVSLFTNDTFFESQNQVTTNIPSFSGLFRSPVSLIATEIHWPSTSLTTPITWKVCNICSRYNITTSYNMIIYSLNSKFTWWGMIKERSLDAISIIVHEEPWWRVVWRLAHLLQRICKNHVTSTECSSHTEYQSWRFFNPVTSTFVVSRW